jgi:hypothetical protein
MEMRDLGVNILNFKTTSNEVIKLLEGVGFIRMPYTKDFQAMYTFLNADAAKKHFLAAGSDEIYFGYGNYF